MQEFLAQLSENLIYIKHKTINNEIHIYCETKKEETKTVHQYYNKIIKDVPFGNFQTILHIKIKRYINDDRNLNKKTITEQLSFLNTSKRLTKRLEDKLYEMTIENSFISTERFINKEYAKISDSTLLRIFKKKKKI